jgi:hypothetical protein
VALDLSTPPADNVEPVVAPVAPVEPVVAPVALAAEVPASDPAAVGTYIVRVLITGTRNGEPWPAIGESIELPAQEAASYLLSGVVKLPE